jgi:hypothetical protein
VAIEMSSAAFAPRIVLGTVVDGAFRELARADADRRSARLVARLEPDRSYVIRVAGLRADGPPFGGTGPYELRVTSPAVP